jgi:hypothetical protein
MSSEAADLLNKIKKLYTKRDTYMAHYSADVWISLTLCIIFILTTIYYHSSNVLEVVKADWPNQRCNPLYMPFAGYINKPADQTNSEFTSANFANCVHSLLTYVTNIAVQPIQLAMSALNKLCEIIIKAVNELRKLLNYLRDKFKFIFDYVFAVVANIYVIFLAFIVNMKDLLAKVEGILTASLFTILGSYLTMQALFMSIVNYITMILRIIARIIFVFIGISEKLDMIPLLGYLLSIPPMLLALPIVLAMVAIFIPMLLFQMGLTRAMGVSVPILPGIPSCFAGDTVVEMAVGATSKKIMDIAVGDVLKNGSTVTAVLKLSAAGQNVYNLNGVLVSGEHRVLLGPNYYSWLRVKDHPASIFVPEFKEPYLYCLNTDKKCFTIGETTYSDWDDIDDKVLASLKQHCWDLPINFSLTDIHPYIDYGFQGDTTFVELMDGTMLPIRDVKVGDVLARGAGAGTGGDNVRGIIKIAAHDMPTYTHKFGNGNTICGTKNIHLSSTNPLDKMNSILESVPMKTTEIYFYHLLTDSAFFVANNIQVRDYNSGIDIYLQ